METRMITTEKGTEVKITVVGSADRMLERNFAGEYEPKGRHIYVQKITIETPAMNYKATVSYMQAVKNGGVDYAIGKLGLSEKNSDIVKEMEKSEYDREITENGGYRKQLENEEKALKEDCEYEKYVKSVNDMMTLNGTSY